MINLKKVDTDKDLKDPNPTSKPQEQQNPNDSQISVRSKSVPKLERQKSRIRKLN